VIGQAISRHTAYERLRVIAVSCRLQIRAEPIRSVYLVVFFLVLDARFLPLPFEEARFLPLPFPFPLEAVRFFGDLERVVVVFFFVEEARFLVVPVFFVDADRERVDVARFFVVVDRDRVVFFLVPVVLRVVFFLTSPSSSDFFEDERVDFFLGAFTAYFRASVAFKRKLCLF